MKLFLLLAAMIMTFVPMQIHGSLMNFAKMVQMTTRKLYWPSYKSYGCYCGYGGNGSPKDATDRCCFVHDCCYYDLEKQGCDPIFLNYEFTFENGIITCAANQDFCKKELCQCDKAAAECFVQNLGSYSKKYLNYPDFLCDGKPPKC